MAEVVKVKVNLEINSYNAMLEDVKLFKFYKADNTPNKNQFFNQLLVNYGPLYEKEYLNAFKKINKIIKDDKKTSLVLADLEALKADSCNNYFVNDLTFMVLKNNVDYYQKLANNLNNISASKLFRNLLLSYENNPAYIRERYLFKDKFDLIIKSIELKKRIMISVNGQNHHFSPYKLDINNEKKHNYVIGINDDKGKIRSYMLSDIKKIEILDEEVAFSKEMMALLDKNILNGINYPFDKEYQVGIMFSNNAVKMFENNVINRPEPLSVNGNMYTFSCSFTQLKNYFFAFGSEIVVYGKRLKKELKDEYKKAFETE